ncbi:MAG TPA: glycosyltransferase family 2 protein [Candidatus Eisenbacteria bacterium]|nr:glycosyltransferase family 2 protein [Candidatus Eisenbacteria bacterium]
MAEDTPPQQSPRSDRGQLAWSVLLNSILVAAFVLGAIPMVAIVRGFIEMVAQSKIRSGADWLAYGFAFTGLFLGAVFFAYAIKYYLSTAMVLITTLAGGGARNGNGHGSNGSSNSNGLNRINGNGNGYHIDLGYHPFVSVHVAAYNEKRVIERLLVALDQLTYPAYEVVVVDDSTDESIQILQRWRDRPRFKILHRNSRQGYKGGALREALKYTDPRAEYIVIFDADSMPFPDSIERLLPHFYRVTEGPSSKRLESAFGRNDPPSEPGQIKRRLEVAAVQSYQWHVLNKSESWLTEAVRAEYAGSYMIERPFQDAIGALKMIAGTAYMIRAEVLREVGWGTSITEDWELTLKLYARGYKVVYTPWAETPAECVSTFARLARQRMRWAEGHTYNIRRYFLQIIRSPFVTPLEKLEFLYDSTYYLQAGLFVIGSLSWVISEVVFHTHVPGWTALLGWSLLFSNIFALPLMNLGGLILEEAPRRDLQGVLGALVLSFALVPFQAWAAFKGLISKEEGPWFRTPKTGRVTDEVHHLRRLNLLRRWLMGPRARRLEWKSPATPAVSRSISRLRNRWAGWAVALALLASFAGMVWLASRAPVVTAAGNPLYLHGSGTAPGCTPSTLDQTIGTQVTACTIQSAAGGVTSTWGFTNLPAQTVAAGVWTFTMYWTGGSGATSDTVTVSAGVSATASCALFVATIPNVGSTWSTTYGSSGVNTTSPFTVSTSASQLALVIPPGGSLCVSVTLTHNTGGKPSMVYDGTAGVGDTRIVPPSIIVPENLVGFVGLALLIPLFTARRRLLALVRVRA